MLMKFQDSNAAVQNAFQEVVTVVIIKYLKYIVVVKELCLNCSR